MSISVDDLREQLAHPDAGVRLSAVHSLLLMGKAARPAFEAVAARLRHDESADVRAQAAELLGEMFTMHGIEESEFSTAAITALAAALRDPHWHTRYLAAEALYRFGSQAVGHVRQLRRLAVEDPDDRVRSSAAYSADRLEGLPYKPV